MVWVRGREVEGGILRRKQSFSNFLLGSWPRHGGLMPNTHGLNERERVSRQTFSVKKFSTTPERVQFLKKKRVLLETR